MVQNGVVRSTCGLCYGGCGVLVHLKNGRAVKIEGDPESPINNGKLCGKGLSSLEYLYHPDRLTYPLQRVGERGDGTWRKLPWDEALDMVADEFLRTKTRYGPESLAMIQGAAKGIQDSYLVRLANAFGTPNLATQGPVCHLPRMLASRITCGFMPIPDREYPPNCMVIWGFNPSDTFFFNFERIHKACERGTRLVVIDPRETGLAREADLWLRVRPGSDLALALAMIHVIIDENLFDRGFVDTQTQGFDKLKTHVQDYPPEKVEALTWVDAKTIRQAAQFYASNRPACIEWGNSLDHTVNSFQTGRALCILRALTGNLEVPGGELRWTSLALMGRRSPELELWDRMPMAQWQKRVDVEHKLLPVFRYVTPQSIIQAILYEKPYPIRAAYIQGANPVLTYSNAAKTHEALTKLDFLVVADMFMTPTANLADLALPVAGYLEHDSVVATPAYPIAQVQQKVAQIGECRSDYEILSDLARRLGLGDAFWDTEQQCLDALLKPAGLTFNEFKKTGVICGTKHYRSYETDGFETPSAKVELYSSQLEQWGFDPLPSYRGLPETEFTEPNLEKEYPFVMTSWKSAPFRHSGGRQIPPLRKEHPEPVVTIHPETAKNLGIMDGDQVYIETRRGKIRQKAFLSTMLDPRVVGVDYGWWFPEVEAADSYGWRKSNINILTEDRPPFNQEIGSTNLRGSLCRVYEGGGER